MGSDGGGRWFRVLIEEGLAGRAHAASISDLLVLGHFYVHLLGF
jgi:hypothetical protein